MTDNINPSHYKDGPFECIELSRLLSSDWGQAVQYCFRWQHKNGVEDLKKALWFINDAITHNVPFFAACCKRNADILEAQAIRLLSILQAENWADLEQFWRNLKYGDRVDVLEALTEKINEIDKKTNAGFQMETVKTGDVTWACLKHNGEYIGCNTVETVK